jgi:5,10-methylenetetrahydrofolate reductase
MSDLKSGSHLERVLAAGEFAVTAELGPPKSCDLAVIDEKASYLKSCVDAVNVTDNQTAIVRIASLAVAKLLVDRGLEPVMQMTCRDRNRLAIQADIMGAYCLGIRNLLCLTGDHQCFGNHPTARHVYDLDSIQLIDAVRAMRDQGVFLCGDELRASKKADLVPPRMYIGAAANPFGTPYEYRPARLAQKAHAGVDFVQTQCIYDMDRFDTWMAEVRNRGLHEKVKILAGLTPFKSSRMAQYMAKNVAGIAVPDELLARMEAAEDGPTEGIKICTEQIDRLRNTQGVAGIHLMAIEWEKKVPAILEQANLLPRPTIENETSEA